MSDKDDKGKGKEKEEDLPQRKEDLPYGGDRIAAMRNRDAKAMRIILRWAQANSKPVVENEKPLPVIARPCKNEQDYISNSRWDDNNLPNIFITFLNSDGLVEGKYCYKREDLVTAFHIQENNLAAWVLPIEASFDNDGFVIIPEVEQTIDNKYADASIVERFVKIPIMNLIEKRSFVESMTARGVNNFVAFPMYKTRTGNISGEYGSSQKHGQTPDDTIYYMAPVTELTETEKERLYKRAYEQLYKLKTGDMNPSPKSKYTLDMIGNLQDIYPISAPDYNYYIAGLDFYHSIADIEQDPDIYTIRNLKPVRRRLFEDEGAESSTGSSSSNSMGGSRVVLSGWNSQENSPVSSPTTSARELSRLELQNRNLTPIGSTRSVRLEPDNLPSSQYFEDYSDDDLPVVDREFDEYGDPLSDIDHDEDNDSLLDQ